MPFISLVTIPFFTIEVQQARNVLLGASGFSMMSSSTKWQETKLLGSRCLVCLSLCSLACHCKQTINIRTHGPLLVKSPLVALACTLGFEVWIPLKDTNKPLMEQPLIFGLLSGGSLVEAVKVGKDKKNHVHQLLFYHHQTACQRAVHSNHLTTAGWTFVNSLHRMTQGLSLEDRR